MYTNLRVVGDPLGAVKAPLQGYNVYRRHTLSGPDELIAVAPAGSTSIDIAGLDDGTQQYVRVAAVSKLGREDDEPINRTKLKRVDLDGDGELLGAVPNPVDGLELVQAAGGAISGQFAYHPARQAVAPSLFRVYVARNGAAFDYDTPATTVQYAPTRTLSFNLGPYADKALVSVAIGSVAASGAEQQKRPTRQVIADAAAPAVASNLWLEVTP